MLELQQTSNGYDLYIDRCTNREEKITLDLDNLDNLAEHQRNFVKAHI